MFKLKLDDFIEEIKGEIVCYEELGEEKAETWEKNFMEYIQSCKNKNVIKKEGNISIALEDENDIFSIVDNYFAAVDSNEEEVYWKKFDL